MTQGTPRNIVMYPVKMELLSILIEGRKQRVNPYEAIILISKSRQ